MFQIVDTGIGGVGGEMSNVTYDTAAFLACQAQFALQRNWFPDPIQGWFAVLKHGTFLFRMEEICIAMKMAWKPICFNAQMVS